MAKSKPQRKRVKGESWVWLSGGAVATGIVMIVAMLALIVVEGTAAFWPHNVDAFVMGETLYVLRHPEQGQVWISQDNTQLVVSTNGEGYREVNGTPVNAPPNVRPVPLPEYVQHREVFQRYPDRVWRLRNRAGNLVIDKQGNPLTPDQFLEDPERFRPSIDRGDPNANELLTVEDAEHGVVLLNQTNDAVLTRVNWRTLDGTPVPLNFLAPRQATTADYRDLPDLFGKTAWQIADRNGQVVQDEAGNPVTVQQYISSPDQFPSPWGYLDDKGNKVSVEEVLGEDRWRDHRLLVGTPRNERAMDIRALAPHPDGSPVQAHELSDTPTEILIRQGNQGETLYGGSAYFRWVRTNVPNVEDTRRYRTSTYNEIVLQRLSLPYIAMIERLEGGVLNGYVTRVRIEEKIVADIEKDGREAVWERFLQEQERMHGEYQRRHKIEKKEMGRVNADLKDLSDDLERIRYDNRDSRLVVAMLERLQETYKQWQALQPPIEEDPQAEEYERVTDEWLQKLPEVLKPWQQEVEKKEATESERRALERAKEKITALADVQANRFSPLNFEVARLREVEKTATYDFITADGREATLPLYAVVRAFRPNELGLFGKLGVYLDRVWEYLTDDPRESNTEGGIWPVILGTLVMTLIMCVAVVPFGVIAALYLREYARQGTLVSAVRISVNNLAGVPSIVFGIFGLGFFCVMVGGTIDDLFFPELLPAPTFGGGGVLWAALTLALLTVPVVIVSTEESLSAVPSSQREASLACGASKFQTIWRVILPQAMPGVLTGTILAMARGAGEVAPLMLVGAVKYEPSLALDTIPPFLHLERKFMHLGFHVYDVGFQSPNVDNTKPLVFATALVLIVLVAVLNIFAITLRNKLRKKLATSAV